MVMVTQRSEGNVAGIREDGRRASFALERIGPVYAPVYPLREPFIEDAFAAVHANGKELIIPEPRLRDARAEETDALNLIDETIESIVPMSLSEAERASCTEALWAAMDDAAAMHRGARQIESLRDEVWQPF